MIPKKEFYTMANLREQITNLNDIFRNNHFYVEDYQREYAWTEKQINELCQDLWSKFEKEYSKNKSSKINNYPRYFLGLIALRKGNNKDIYEIIDGQQRMSSLTLLFLHFYNFLEEEKENLILKKILKDNEELIEDKIQLRELFWNKKENYFNLDIETRNDYLTYLKEKNNLDYSFQNIKNDQSIKNLSIAFENIQLFFSEKISTYKEMNQELSLSPFYLFSKWLINRVYLIPFVAEEEENPNEIFQTMNNRGLDLNPIDLFKNELFSKIKGNTRLEEEARNTWKEIQRTLVELEFSLKKSNLNQLFQELFFYFIKGKYATKDQFDSADVNYWFFKLDSEKENFYEIFLKEIQKTLKWFVKMKKSEIDYNHAESSGLLLLYKIAKISLTNLTYIGSFSVISINDSEEVTLKKINLFLTYLDILLHKRLWKNLSIAQNNIKHNIFTPSLKLRNSSIDKIKLELSEQIKKEVGFNFYNDLNLFYKQTKGGRSNIVEHIKIILTRIYEEAEKEIGDSYDFDKITAKGKLDIEHIFSSTDFDKNRETQEIFLDNSDDFNISRNYLPSLLLYSSSSNRGLGSSTYKEKIKAYEKDSFLLNRCLSPYYIKRNAEEGRVILKYNLKGFEIFDKEAINERRRLYSEIASQIWNINRLE